MNEDASGDVISLQRQIQQLKVGTILLLIKVLCMLLPRSKALLYLKQGQLSFLLKHHKPSMSMSSVFPSFEDSTSHDLYDDNDSSEEVSNFNDHELQRGREDKVIVSST